MSPSKRMTSGAVAHSINGSVNDVWNVLTDGEAWSAWWPDGALEQPSSWAVAEELEWPNARNSENRHATITGLHPPDDDAGHEVAAAILWFKVPGADVEFRFRVDGVAPGLTNVIISCDGPTVKGWGFKVAGEQLRLDKEAKGIADALKKVVETRGAARGPRFTRRSKEPFLSWDLNAYLTQGEAIRIHHEAYRPEESGPMHASGAVPVEILVRFPELCSGCLERTNHTVECASNISSSWTDGGMTRTQTVRTTFEVPLCERCASYGLDSLIYISGHSINVPFQKKDLGNWVTFRLPNVAYYQPFLDANGLPHDRIAPGKDDAQRATQRGRDVAKLETQLRSWIEVRDGVGFHTYAQLKYRLLQLKIASRADLETLGAEYSVSLEQLADVGRISGDEIPALKILTSHT
jgi:hypothetical protein